jgi:hypothetical protein
VPEKSLTLNSLPRSKARSRTISPSSGAVGSRAQDNHYFIYGFCIGVLIYWLFSMLPI